MFFDNKNENIILKIRVIPNSKENCIKEIIGDTLKIKINAPPKENKANNELICFLAEVLHIKKSDIEIIKGLKSREKLIEIKNINKDVLLKEIYAQSNRINKK
ncbi:MAG: DUF167 domain-containing protein [Candidatus Goldbacteria bacterium]|nr:DUF167 domain-containing protein [Candidatus Goldiibacteriota bacterium]